MYLLLIPFWCSAVMGRLDGLNNSRFGGFNSRLGPFEFPVSPLREFADNGLIWRIVFADKRQFCGRNRRNSRLYGNNRELVPGAGRSEIKTAKLVGGRNG
jgi:hypothetical protein